MMDGGRSCWHATAGSRRGGTAYVAGFVEPGESLEECAQREVLEEVGIRIKNVRYFEEPTLALPQLADDRFHGGISTAGEIKLEESEIADAGWFSAPNRFPACRPE